MYWYWNAFAITLSFQGRCINVLPQHVWMHVLSELMLVWGPEALCPPGAQVVHLCLLFFWDADVYLMEKSWCLHPLGIRTRSHGVITTISLGVVDGAGLTLFKRQGHSNIHLGQLPQFISLPSDWSKLISHPPRPTSYVPGQGWREETSLLHKKRKG